MKSHRSLNTLAPGEKGIVAKLCCSGSMRRRLLDIGLTENTCITCLGRSPGGDPSAYLIRGAVIAIRNSDAASILINKTERGV